MTCPLSDVEIAVLHVRQARIAVVEQRQRTAFLKARGHSTELAEHLLSTLVTGLELTKKHLHLVIDHLPGYRYHLIRGGEIEAVQRCAASDDAEAILRVTL